MPEDIKGEDVSKDLHNDNPIDDNLIDANPQDDDEAILKSSPYPRLDIPEGEKPELMEYLNSLPEAEVPPDFENDLADEQEEEKEEIAVEKSPEQLKAEALAQRIRENTIALQVTPRALLLGGDSETPKILEMLSTDEAFKDIAQMTGQNDTYYYSSSNMTSQYANIAVLVKEGDHFYTVASLVRYHTKEYPTPTAAVYFEHSPYDFSKEMINQVREGFKSDPKYADIKEIITENRQIYFYSSDYMTDIYATALAERAEELGE